MSAVRLVNEGFSAVLPLQAQLHFLAVFKVNMVPDSMKLDFVIMSSLRL